MKKYIFACLFFLFATTSYAVPISLNNGEYKFTGDAFIAASGLGGTAYGIGRILTIQQGSDIIWSSGDGGYYLNYIFNDFTTVSTTGPLFEATGGWVKFYITTDSTVFDASIDPIAAMSNIASSGDLLISAVANGKTLGVVTATSYSSNGYLDIVDDPSATDDYYYNALNTDSVVTFDPSVMADMSFGLTGNVNNGTGSVNPGYAYIASGDLQGTAEIPLPEPDSLALLGLGLVVVGTLSNKRALASLAK